MGHSFGKHSKSFLPLKASLRVVKLVSKRRITHYLKHSEKIHVINNKTLHLYSIFNWYNSIVNIIIKMLKQTLIKNKTVIYFQKESKSCVCTMNKSRRPIKQLTDTTIPPLVFAYSTGIFVIRLLDKKLKSNNNNKKKSILIRFLLFPFETWVRQEEEGKRNKNEKQIESIFIQKSR